MQSGRQSYFNPLTKLQPTQQSLNQMSKITKNDARLPCDSVFPVFSLYGKGHYP